MQPQETDIVKYDSSEDLLIAIDFQNVYLPGQPWACPTMEHAMAKTLSIINDPNSPDYILTQYIAAADPVGRWKQYNEEYAPINADPFLSDFADPVKQIIKADNVMVKNTYSSLKCPAVQARLEGKKRVVLTGVVAECCVMATMLDAIDLGYEVIYLYDCVSGLTDENEALVRILAESFSPIHTRVLSSTEYLQLISNHQ